MTAVYFSHGQESGPWGTKIIAMAERMRDIGCRAESVDYQGITDPLVRVDKLLAEAGGINERLFLVGSSMGGYVATAAADRLAVAGLFVLAPAYFIPGYEELPALRPGMPVGIVHGWRDDVVPVDNSIRFARENRAALHLLDSDHRLTDQIDTINELLVSFISSVTGD